METEVRTPRPEKVAVVDEVRESSGRRRRAIVTEYRGLTVAEIQVLRRALAAAGGEYKVYKNTLVRRAAHGKRARIARRPARRPDRPRLRQRRRFRGRQGAEGLRPDATRSSSSRAALLGSGLFDAAQTSAPRRPAVARRPARPVRRRARGADAALPVCSRPCRGTSPTGSSALIEQRGGGGRPPAGRANAVAETLTPGEEAVGGEPRSRADAAAVSETGWSTTRLEGATRRPSPPRPDGSGASRRVTPVQPGHTRSNEEGNHDGDETEHPRRDREADGPRAHRAAEGVRGAVRRDRGGAGGRGGRPRPGGAAAAGEAEARNRTSSTSSSRPLATRRSRSSRKCAP